MCVCVCTPRHFCNSQPLDHHRCHACQDPFAAHPHHFFHSHQLTTNVPSLPSFCPFFSSLPTPVALEACSHV